MATLTAWKFNNPNGAEDALRKLEKLHQDRLLNLHDAAEVSWEAGRKQPISTYLSSEQEAKLREAFGIED